MNSWLQTFLLFFLLFNILIFIKGFYESKYKKNAYGKTKSLFFIGAFVWADAVVFGLFWTIVTISIIYLKDLRLFLLIISVFWVVRGLGESIYWFNQQFSTVNRNPIKHHTLYTIFHDDSVWFVDQIIWQCITVLSIVASIYFSWLWLQKLSS